MSRFVGTTFALMAFLLMPAATYAQGSIAGSVRDSSGSVLPGVTVEASSPALIEKTRAGPANTKSSTSGPAPMP